MSPHVVIREYWQVADIVILLLAGAELPPASVSAAAAAAAGMDPPAGCGVRGDVALALLRAQGLPTLAVAAQVERSRPSPP